MATTKPTQDKTPESTLLVPGNVNGQDVLILDGPAVLDKAELIGRAFNITAVKQEVTKRDYAQVWVEGEFVDDKEPFTFVDSSSGVRFQLEQVLQAYGKAELLDEWIDLPTPILAPKGLRVSDHQQRDRNTGKMVPVKTYYVTTAGRRRRDDK